MAAGIGESFSYKLRGKNAMDWLFSTLLGVGLIFGFFWLLQRLTSRLVNFILYGDSRDQKKPGQSADESFIESKRST